MMAENTKRPEMACAMGVETNKEQHQSVRLDSIFSFLLTLY